MKFVAILNVSLLWHTKDRLVDITLVHFYADTCLHMLFVAFLEDRKKEQDWRMFNCWHIFTCTSSFLLSLDHKLSFMDGKRELIYIHRHWIPVLPSPLQEYFCSALCLCCVDHIMLYIEFEDTSRRRNFGLPRAGPHNFFSFWFPNANTLVLVFCFDHNACSFNVH